MLFLTEIGHMDLETEGFIIIPCTNIPSFRSTKYSEILLETTSAAPPPANPPSEPQQPPTEMDPPPSLDLSSTQIQPLLQPAATSSPQQESLIQTSETTDPERESGPMLYLSESLQESVPGDVVGKPVTEEETSAVTLEHSQAAAVSHTEAVQIEPLSGALGGPVVPQPRSVSSPEPSVQQPTRPKKDKLTRLKELGLDPPPVAKLCPDDGSFVQLEPPQHNPGELWLLLEDKMINTTFPVYHKSD